MSLSVTLLLDAGKPDPSWTLTEGQADTFAQLLRDSPAVSDPGGALIAHRRYGGFLVTSGGGDRWVVFRGWVRGGLVTQYDDGRALELWLLETGRAELDPKLAADLVRDIAPRN